MGKPHLACPIAERPAGGGAGWGAGAARGGGGPRLRVLRAAPTAQQGCLRPLSSIYPLSQCDPKVINADYIPNPEQNCLQSQKSFISPDLYYGWENHPDPGQWASPLAAPPFPTKKTKAVLFPSLSEGGQVTSARGLKPQMESTISPAEIKANFPACLGSPGSVSFPRDRMSRKLLPAASLP